MNDEIIKLTELLLQSIADRDWATYEKLCADDLTCFEPEARGHLVHGLPFHQFYFENPAEPSRQRTSLHSPHVRMLGENSAVVAYVRLIQRDGSTHAYEETRVWHRMDGRWRHIHFHRSSAG